MPSFQRGNKLLRLLSAGVRLASEEDVNRLGLFGAETTVLADMPDDEDED